MGAERLTDRGPVLMPGPTRLSLQPRQPVPGILGFGQAGVGVLPEVEDALILLDDFWALLWPFLAQLDS
jgi:hypothetical protein